MTLSRRAFLGGAAAAAGLCLARSARAIGPSSKFRIAELTVPGAGPPARSSGLARLLWELEIRTSVDVAREPMPVPLGGRLQQSPFLWFSGDRRFPIPGPSALEALRRFLTFGGFLVIDSTEGRAGGEFDASVRQLARELFPAATAGGDHTLAPLPADHVIYKSFYLTAAVAGRVAVARELEALHHDGRAVLVYSQNDLAGAWQKDDLGNYVFQCYPGGDDQREHAFRLGINLAMYALCLDYKTDQVHVPFILKRRRWRVDNP